MIFISAIVEFKGFFYIEILKAPAGIFCKLTRLISSKSMLMANPRTGFAIRSIVPQSTGCCHFKCKYFQE